MHTLSATPRLRAHSFCLSAQALAAGDLKAVFVLAEPEKIPRHNIYEFVWLLKTGLPRIKRVLLGKEKMVTDLNILFEGYRHHGNKVRTTQLGYGRLPRPELIDNKQLWSKFVGGKVRSLLREGPDRRPTAYTP